MLRLRTLQGSGKASNIGPHPNAQLVIFECFLVYTDILNSYRIYEATPQYKITFK